MALGIGSVSGRIFEVAGGVAVAGLADKLQQCVVAGAPVETIGLVKTR